ncbi:hypothetical protein SeMB42_g05959 [Synchytrium endobioticum]|uniref:GP-PDE domain-containing protein n=1 Tax=Synchytrium endobioticum TaxID=286115 RepID=A0A507CMZ9_9FUNG|nr:hypothetical protein SeMB42_g05959 [Synchytrium endobioticum]
MAPITQPRLVLKLGSFDGQHSPYSLSSFPSASTFVINVDGEETSVSEAATSGLESIEFDVADAMNSRIAVIACNNRGAFGQGSFTLDSPHLAVYGEQKPLSGIYKCTLMNAKLEVIGSVTCEAVVVTPYARRFAGKGKPWNFTTPQVIGHRGTGAQRQFVNGGQRLQLGENTVLSLTMGGELGAIAVEFDVQVTKDNVPVIYHDFFYSELGPPLSISALTASEFKSFRPPDRPADRSVQELEQRRTLPFRRTRSLSDISPCKFTTPYIRKNGTGTIQSPFASLKDVLTSVPAKVGFNIEIKILDDVAEFGGERMIIFSSFHPEVARALKLKQDHYPVLFLTQGGTHTDKDLTDPRVISLDGALDYAKKVGLDGLVTHVPSILEDPSWVKKFKDAGLLVFTYGTGSNDVGTSLRQAEWGVDGIIVDHVKEIVMALKDKRKAMRN